MTSIVTWSPAAQRIVDALKSLAPGAQWVLRGDTLADLEWLDTAIAQPSADAITNYVPPQPVPASVTPRQARLALLSAGLLDRVQAAVDAAGGATKITWEYATEVKRDDALIISIGSSLSLTSDQIDALFRAAASL